MNSFEMNLEEIQRIVTTLENDDLPLEEVFELYKKGMLIAEEMNKQISDITAKITELEKEKGKFTEVDFSSENRSSE